MEPKYNENKVIIKSLFIKKISMLFSHFVLYTKHSFLDKLKSRPIPAEIKPQKSSHLVPEEFFILLLPQPTGISAL